MNWWKLERKEEGDPFAWRGEGDEGRKQKPCVCYTHLEMRYWRRSLRERCCLLLVISSDKRREGEKSCTYLCITTHTTHNMMKMISTTTTEVYSLFTFISEDAGKK